VGGLYLAFVVVIVAGSLAVMAAAMRRNARLSRRIGAPPAEPFATFRGNMWSPGIGGSFGFRSRLEFSDWGISLRAGRSLPRYDVQWGELGEVQVGRHVWPGIKVSSAVFTEPVYFETFQPVPQILEQFSRHGVAVNLQPARFPLWSRRK
jgi:hypothetical protein